MDAIPVSFGPKDALTNAERLISIQEACRHNNELGDWVERAKIECQKLDEYIEEGKRRRIEAMNTNDESQVRYIDGLCDQLAQFSHRLHESIDNGLLDQQWTPPTTPEVIKTNDDKPQVSPPVVKRNVTPYKILDVPKLLKGMGIFFVGGSVIALGLRALLHLNDYQSGSFIFLCLFCPYLWRVWKWSVFKSRSKIKRVLIVTGAYFLSSLIVAIVAWVVVTVIGVVMYSTQPKAANVTPNIVYATIAPPTVDVAAQHYIQGAYDLSTSFNGNINTISSVFKAAGNNTFSLKYNPELKASLIKASDSLNAAYSLLPPERFMTAHSHLLNATTNYQQYVSAYIAWMNTPTYNNADVAAQRYQYAVSFYPYFMSEWNLFNSEMRNATNQ